MYVIETNIDDFGRFSSLKEKVNREIAKAYIEQLEGEQISAFNPSGTWIFTEGIGIPTRKTTTSGLSSCVVTCEQLSVAFMNLFNKLSAEIYSKTHIPSCVGEIIYTTKLKNEAMVKKYYGDYTSWVQLPGRIRATHA